ncbi:NAD(P)H-dependent D-xylose reductase (XR), partial [Claviceps africana]
DLRRRASWTVRAGLGNPDCYSFESVRSPGSFLRHLSHRLVLNPNDGSKQYAEDATFCTLPGLNGTGDSIRSWNHPTRVVRHYQRNLYVAADGGVNDFDATASYNDDVTLEIGDAFA